MKQNLDTDKLVKLSQAGDLDAFERLVLSYSNWLLGLCVSISGRRDVEDLCQEIWLTAWKSIGSLKDERKFKAWLRVLGTRKVISSMKSQFKFEELSEDIVSDSTDQDVIVSTQQQMEFVLSQLNEGERAIIVLKELEGMTNREIGETLGIPEGTVKSKGHNLKRKVKSIVEKISEEDGFE